MLDIAGNENLIYFIRYWLTNIGTNWIILHGIITLINTYDRNGHENDGDRDNVRAA